MVLANITDSGKLFHAFVIRVQNNTSLNANDIYGWLLNYAPWFYNLDVFSKLKITLVSYLPVNNLKTSIILPLIRLYFKVGNFSCKPFLIC